MSKLEGKDDVSASYLLTIRKASVTITAPDINITYGMTQEEAIEKAEEAGAIVSGGLKLEDITMSL